MKRLNTILKYSLAVIVALQTVTFFSSTPLVVAAYENEVTPLASVHYLAQNDFLQLTNLKRQARGLSSLTINKELTQAAEHKALDMKEKGYWDHFRPSDNKSPWDFIKESGYPYRVAGENLAKGFKTPEGIMNAWMESPAHAANILSPKYTEVGFATIQSTDISGQSILLTVQMFGTR